MNFERLRSIAEHEDGQERGQVRMALTLVAW